MKSLKYVLLVALLLGAATPAEAFNGLRKGFVLGGGLGIAPVVKWEAEGPLGDADESKVGFGSNFLIGYGWNEQNMIVFEGNGASMQSDEFGGGAEAILSQGFGGPAWYHYFKPVAPSPFTVVGAGFYSFWYDIEDGEEDSNDSGFGIMGGGGFEFSRHWQITVVVHGGTTDNRGVDFSHLTVSALIGGVAF